MKFWEVNNLSNGEGELLLYGEIRSSKPWWSEGNIITPSDFLKDIEKLKNKSKVTVRLNSGGGDVFAAQAIYTQLKSMSANIEIIIDGIAASAATIIAMAGDTVRIPKGAAFMIHNPSVTVWDSFESKDLEQLKNMLDSVKACIIETYCTKTSLSKEELSEMMNQEVWLTGVEAVEKGFCDELFEKENPVNKILNNRTLMINNVVHDLSGFKAMPKLMPVENEQNPNQPLTTQPVVKNIEEGDGKIMTVEELRAHHPEIINQLEASAREEGAKNERQRIQEIEQISNSIALEIVNKAKFEEPIDAKELAFMALQDDKNRAQNFLANLNQDDEESGVDNVAVGGTEPTKAEQAQAKINQFVNALNGDKRRVK